MPRSLSSFLLLVLTVTCAAVQLGCERRRPPSVLVIAADHLAFHLSLCTREPTAEGSGFHRLCEESIRFTHAATPSVLSVPALASILTGLFPVDHGVRHNGSPGLKAPHRTFAEAALNSGRRTAFFSGGPPVWRRTGLHQGFEIFEDTVSPSSGRLFRPLSETASTFVSWLTGDVGADPFAAVIYAPDLSFVDTVTESATGEVRALNPDSQLEEFDESLDELFRALKTSRRWNDTIVILAGLNGHENTPRPGEIGPMLLNSENTQVTLFIKPSIKERDGTLHWTVDRNVSLVDVGRTIFEVFDSAPSEARSGLESVSLIKAMTNSKDEWPEGRVIPVESGWASWQAWGPVRMGAITEHDLVLDDEKPAVYNTLVDRLETSPQGLDDEAREALTILEKAGSVPWPGLDADRRALFRVPALYWLMPARAPALHRELMELSKAKQVDDRVWRWAAQSCLEQHDWKELERIGAKTKRADWLAIAHRNLGKRDKLDHPCLGLLGSAKGSDRKVCTDETFLSLLGWMQAENTERKDAAKRRFVKAWESHQADLRVLKANAGLGLLWLPATAERELPSVTSMALALPEVRRFNP